MLHKTTSCNLTLIFLRVNIKRDQKLRSDQNLKMIVKTPHRQKKLLQCCYEGQNNILTSQRECWKWLLVLDMCSLSDLSLVGGGGGQMVMMVVMLTSMTFGRMVLACSRWRGDLLAMPRPFTHTIEYMLSNPSGWICQKKPNLSWDHNILGLGCTWFRMNC